MSIHDAAASYDDLHLLQSGCSFLKAAMTSQAPAVSLTRPVATATATIGLVMTSPLACTRSLPAAAAVSSVSLTPSVRLGGGALAYSMALSLQQMRLPPFLLPVAVAYLVSRFGYS